MEVRDQVVRNNRAWGNSDHGITLRTLQDRSSKTTWWPTTRAASSSTTWNTPPARQPHPATPWAHLSAGSTRNKVEGNDFIGNREQVRYVAHATSAGAPTAAITGATTWAGTVTATAWAMCPTKPTTWWTA